MGKVTSKSREVKLSTDGGVRSPAVPPGALEDVDVRVALIQSLISLIARRLMTMRVRFSEIEVSYSARGIPSYSIEIWHDGLKKHRQIKGSEYDVVERKANLQAEEWESRWEVVRAKAERKQYQENQKALASERTRSARANLDDLEKTLEYTLSLDHVVDWGHLKDSSPFSEPPPEKPSIPEPPQAPNLPLEPLRGDPRFKARIGILDFLIASRRKKKEAQASEKFKKAHDDWQRTTSCLREEHRAALEKHARLVEELRKNAAKMVSDWEKRRDDFVESQRISNAAIDRQREKFESHEPPAIEEYCNLVLARSTYPDWLPQEFETSFVSENSTLVVSYSLPSVDTVPRLLGVTYIMSRDEFNEKELSDPQVRRLYDSLVYQIALRTVYEMFQSDQIGAIDSVVFNGNVTSVDRRTGLMSTACILSLHTTREEFLKINLAQVDPKACFKALKGVGSARLHSLTPISPIMEMRRDDERFVSGREMTDTLDDSVNLAMMDWEDFEHLIRELFEQEFSSNGGEVKVTQASRDGGVDAVAFDPDPIRGGKIVIQAKRYTNTVGVAAVRDLYGTVLNEGATKGVLVTTSDYGGDAYEFAKNKPLVLIGGANLLHLLEKHGHRAKIDIKQAREHFEQQ